MQYPLKFSLAMANQLANLCARLEAESEALCAQDAGTDLFVALRGSGDASDILNLHGKTVVDGIRVGNGLAYGPLARQYQVSLSQSLPRFSGAKRLWLSGHGIGGAFAVIAAAMLCEQGKNVAAVYTFGAPRVGDRGFVKGICCPVFRIVNDLDVMATMPTAWKWRHVGEHKLINANGSMNMNPNPINRFPSIMRQTAWLGEMLAQGLSSGFPRALNTLQERVWGDHALSVYCERLRALSE